MNRVAQSITALIVLLSLTACGSEKVSFSKGEPRSRVSRSMESSDSQAIQPIEIAVHSDGTLVLNNRLQPTWNGVGFVSSRQFDIVPVE